MPIGDLLKTEVFELCSWYRKNFNNSLPIEIITREPSAELRPNQKDSDNLPAYDKLDKAIDNVITNQKSAKTELEKWVLNKSFQSEFKRWQAAPIIRVSKHSFGRGRQMPLAHNFRYRLK
jgi:NAD+ synthase (glutamine-hydrolysing)